MGCFKWIERLTRDCLGKGLKVGKGRDPDRLEKKKQGKIENKWDKRVWLRLNMWVGSTFV